MIVVSAPGKLILSGEWSVLEPGNTAIVMAVDSKSIVKIREKKQTSLSSARFNVKKINCSFDGKELALLNGTAREKHVLRFVKSAAETCLGFFAEKNVPLKNFELSTDSYKNAVKNAGGVYQKAGFGTSAAITVATVGALLELHGLRIKKHRHDIYKLATIAHFLGQGKTGSAADIAASTYGGIISYKRFDGAWLKKETENNSIPAIVEKTWPLFEAEALFVPKNFELLVAFSGKSVSTKGLVEKMEKFKSEQKEEYSKIIRELSEITKEMAGAIKNSDEKKILELVRKNREKLNELGEKSQNTLETAQLSRIIGTMNDLGASAKFSGAGGGDCAIGVCFSKTTRDKIQCALKEKGLNPLQVNISVLGVTRVN